MPESAVAEVPTTSTPASPAQSSAPSSATTSTATPATSAATPASPVSERLTPLSSMKDISKFLRDADAPDATPTTPAVAQPEGATTQPATTAPNPGEVPSTPQGPIPFEAHTKALENARAKVLTQYGITPQVTPDAFQKGLGFARQINENPIQFLNELSASIANHPVWGPQLRSSAGRTLASAPAARPEPDVQVVNAQGQVIEMTYSAKRLSEVQEWDWAQREAKLDQRIQPLVQAHQQQQDLVQQEAFQKEVNAGTESELTRVNEILDGKTELGPEVAKLMAQGVNHIDAALQVRKQFIVPTLTASAEAAVLETQRKKAAGNTVNGTGPSAPKIKMHPGMSQKELAAALREAAEASA